MKKIRTILTGILLVLTLSIFTACGNNNKAADEAGIDNGDTMSEETDNDNDNDNVPDDTEDGTAAQDLGDGVRDVGDSAGDVVEDAGDGAGDVVKDVGDGAGDAVEDVGDAVGDVIDGDAGTR